MISDLIPVVAVVAGLIAVTRVRDLGPHADPGRRAVATAVLGVAAGAAILSPGVARWVEQVSGVANLAEPLARTLLMVAALGAQAIFLLAAPAAAGPSHRVRGRVVVLIVALGAFWTAFAAAPRYPSTSAYYLRHGTNPWVAVMLVIEVGFCGWAFVDLLMGWRRWGTRSQKPLRTGLALMAIGALAGLGWVALKVTGKVAVLTDQAWLQRLTIAPGIAVAAVTALATVSGVVWPGAWERAIAVRRWLVAYRATGRLYGLWRDLVRLRPAVALEPLPGLWRDRLQLRDVRWRLYRRIIEIRDARLALRPHLAASRHRARRRLATPSTVPTGASTPVSGAVLEGYTLADAVHTAPCHIDQDDAPSSHTVSEDGPSLDPVSIDADAAYLSQVADHYRAALTAPPSGSSGMLDDHQQELS